MKVSRVKLEGFFTELVGDELETGQLHDSLALSIRRDRANNKDPYNCLRASIGKEIIVVTDRLCSLGQSSRRDQREWDNIRVNGQLGAKVIVASLRAIGDVYVSQASVPQKRMNVARSTRHGLSHIYNIAYTDRIAGFFSLGAAALGINPRNPLLAPLSFIAELPSPRPLPQHISKRMYTTHSDTSGQIDIQPRYLKPAKVLPRQCPATFARIPGIDHSKPGLVVLMNVLSDVAVDEIYPEQFDIYPDNT